MSRHVRMAGLASLLALALGVAPAFATITIVNMDGPGEGFNDATPAAPVGGNNGTTVGQQRLNDFIKAAQMWDAILQSPVTIKIQASFDPLTPCDATSGVLGGADALTIESDFAGAGHPGTWYATAEANRLTGTDLEPSQNDIVAQFNSNVGVGGCLTGRNWYYGFDDNEGANGIDLLPVLLHEFGHGLGFETFTDETNGAYSGGLPSIFDWFLKDDVTGKHWNEMTAAERVTSAIHTNHLVWDGPAVTAALPHFLGNRPHVVESGGLTGDILATNAAFGAPLTTAGLSGDVTVVNDGFGTHSDACETPFVNAAAVNGHIALIDRGTCTFAVKAANAQAAGAIGILFVNNVAGALPTVSAVAPGITIPIAGITLADGNAIKAAASTVHVVIELDPAHFAGADDGNQLQMYAPNPDQPGSSVSHWDTPAFPNLLMEPAINADLTANVDLTYHAFDDIGWFPQLASVPTAPASGNLALTSGPNPTREGGTLRFRLAVAGDVDIALFDVAGREVGNLAHGHFEAGEHALAWARRDEAGRRVGPGVYRARLRTGNETRSVQVVLVD